MLSGHKARGQGSGQSWNIKDCNTEGGRAGGGREGGRKGGRPLDVLACVGSSELMEANVGVLSLIKEVDIQPMANARVSVSSVSVSCSHSP
jgi:hypothetical protein